jgi:hypothetical protein
MGANGATFAITEQPWECVKPGGGRYARRIGVAAAHGVVFSFVAFCAESVEANEETGTVSLT